MFVVRHGSGHGFSGRSGKGFRPPQTRLGFRNGPSQCHKMHSQSLYCNSLGVASLGKLYTWITTVISHIWAAEPQPMPGACPGRRVPGTAPRAPHCAASDPLFVRDGRLERTWGELNGLESFQPATNRPLIFSACATLLHISTFDYRHLLRNCSDTHP